MQNMRNPESVSSDLWWLSVCFNPHSFRCTDERVLSVPSASAISLFKDYLRICGVGGMVGAFT